MPDGRRPNMAHDPVKCYLFCMTIQPTGNRLLCKPISVDDHYPDSRIVLLPDRLDMETKQQAEIVAVGPGAKDEDGDLIPMDPSLKPGVWVLHNREFGKTEAPDDMFWLTQDDIVAVLE